MSNQGVLSSTQGQFMRLARGLGFAATLGASAFCAHPLLAAPTEARPTDAEPDSVEGRVVAFELGDIVIDVAADRGAFNGAVVDLWRPLNIKHPVTGQMVSDRFLIGRLRLTQVRSALSLARAEGKLAEPAQPGDIVVLAARHSTTPHPAVNANPSSPSEPHSEAASVGTPSAFGTTPGAVSAAPPATAPEPLNSADADADSAEVSALFQHLRGASVPKRVLTYEAYVTHHPKGKYAVVLYEEAAQLRRLLAFDQHTDDRHQSVLRNFEPPREARSNTPLTIALELSNAPTAAVIHSRNSGEVAYHTDPMRRVGEGYFSATIAAERLNSPRLEYFIEGVASDGKAMSVLGSATEPQVVAVEDVPRPKPEPRRPATVTVSTDYADWNNFKGNDVVWQTEGSVGMRLQDVGVRAARMGFGVYRGIGGSLDELDQQKLSGRRVGLTYGYLEGEFGLSHFTSIIGRLVIGLEDDGVNGGAQALLRIGNDRETNLTIGGEALGGIGLRGITELQLATFPSVPILFRTEVTNQPAGSGAFAATPAPLGQVGVAQRQGEVGARAIAQVGYRFLPDLVIAIRGSYQGRTINHAGPGFGGAVTYQW
ncbi:MAG: hypothetical protein ABJB12_16620 [Pseudomonadota bacterium]